jgi:DNA invertase Pin-like site-specific DNA recombinase
VSNVAYSYLRFSTVEQAAGDSRRRQMAMAEKYAAEHHLRLDQSLSFRDLGVSAYRGKNAKEGALRAFLEAKRLSTTSSQPEVYYSSNRSID